MRWKSTQIIKQLKYILLLRISVAQPVSAVGYEWLSVILNYNYWKMLCVHM